MNEIDDLINAIGLQALDHADGACGRVLVYAEVESGVVSADMFYVCDSAQNVRFRFCPPSVMSLVEKFWMQWQKVPGNSEWRVLCYVIDGEDFKMDLRYPDEINEDEDVSERRPLAVEKYFGQVRVDWSRP